MNFADFEPLNAAEKKLLKCSVSGEYTFIKLTRPVQAITNGENVNTVRASFIRWLALGGDDIHPLRDAASEQVFADIDASMQGGNIMAAAPVINHTDEELNLLETLVRRTPPNEGWAGGKY